MISLRLGGITLLICCLGAFRSKAQYADNTTGDALAPVLIHMNQPKYIPGDTVFIGLTVLNVDNHPAGGAQYFHLVLSDSGGAVVSRQLMKVFGGAGASQVILPARLPAGQYVLCAYSRSTTAVSWSAGKALQVVTESQIRSIAPVHSDNSMASTNDLTIDTSAESYHPREKVFITVRHPESCAGVFAIRVLNGTCLEEQDASFSVTSRVASRIAASSSPFMLHGTVYLADSITPVPDHTTVLCFLQQNQIAITSTTLGDGKFRITIPDFPYGDQLFFLCETPEGKLLRKPVVIMDDNEQVSGIKALPFEVLDEPDAYAQFAMRRKLINNAFSPKLAVADEQTQAPWEGEIGGADVKLFLDNYATLPTMSELIHEILRGVKHRKRSGKDIVRVVLDPPAQDKQPSIPHDDPVYIIDGVATTDTQYFLALKPSEVLSIAVVKKPAKLGRVGLMGKNGLIVVQSKKGDLSPGIESALQVMGVNPAMPFVIPDHNGNKAPAAPDFRSTLYWNPLVRTDSNGEAKIEFYCSDDVGEMRIEVSGVCDQGHYFTGTSTFRVRR